MFQIVCPSCAAVLSADEEKDTLFCKYCGARIDVGRMRREAMGGEAAQTAGEETAREEAIPQPEEVTQPEEIPQGSAPEAVLQVPEEEATKKAKKKGGLVIVLALVLLLLGGAAAGYFLLLKPAGEYKAAEALLEEGDYSGAIDAFEALGDYRDAAERLQEAYLKKAEEELGKGKYSRAARTLDNVGSISKADDAVFAAYEAALGGSDMSAPGELVEELKDHIADEDRYEEAAGKKMEELLAAEKDDQLLQLYDALSGWDMSEILGSCVKASLEKSLEEGNITRAAALTARYGSYVDGLADTLLGGISADLEKAIQGSLVIKPETFTQLQSFIGRGDGSAAETAAMSLLLRAWYRHVLYADPQESYVTSLATADLTEEEMAVLRSIILKETPALCGIAESGALWYADQETLTAIETVLLMVGGNDDTAWAFTQFVSYLETGDTIDLPFLDEIRLLWDIREDVRSLCTVGEPFMAFLTGTWGTGKKGENFSLTIKENGVFSLHYELPFDRKNGYLDALNGGFSIVDENRKELVRICDIKILDFKTISVHNTKNDTTYTMTRIGE